MRFILDLETKVRQRKELNQYDNEVLELEVLKGGQVFSLTGYVAELQSRNANNDAIIQTNNITIADNVVTIDLSEDITRVAGTSKLKLKLLKDGREKSSFEFEININQSVLEGSNITTGIAIDVIEALDIKMSQATLVKTELDKSIANGDTVKMKADIIKNTNDISTNATAISTKVDKVTGKGLSTNDFTNVYKAILDTFLDKTYPVGSIYLSMNNTNPGTLFGGTWIAISQGRVLVGVDATQTEFNSAGKTGGSKTHTLTIDEMPIHNHTQKIGGVLTTVNPTAGNGIVGQSNSEATSSTGGGLAHNNLQPYLTCYIWQRTA